MTTIHASNHLDITTITEPDTPPGTAQATAPDTAQATAPADREPASPAASALTAGLSLLAVLTVCAGAAALIGLAVRATLAYFAG